MDRREAFMFSRTAGDVEFRHLEIAGRIEAARNQRVSYEKAIPKPPMYGSLSADLRDAGRKAREVVMQVIREM